MAFFNEKSVLWYNGEFRAWKDATIHVMSHVCHYGSSIFEGIRCYEGVTGPAVFRLREHMLRLVRSCKVYRMDLPYELEVLEEACLQVLRKNDLKEAYIRPLAFRGYHSLGVDPTNCPINVVIGAWPWGTYLGQEALEQGVDVCVSSWQKFRPNTLPAMAKAGGHYLNAQLVKMEAKLNGFAEGILLDANGYVSEGSGENLFLVMDNRVYTSPVCASILPGITRDSVLALLKEMNVELVEQIIPREMLYIADEIFLTGTAAEITPVRSVDRISIGKGRRGEICGALQERFFAIVKGQVADTYNWLTPV